MKLDDLRVKLIAYLDGTLDSGQRSEMTRLLKKSSRYRKELKVLKETLTLTKEDASPDFKPIMWKVPERKRVTWWRWILAPAAVAAAVAVFVIAGGPRIFSSVERESWVMVGSDSLTFEESYQLVNMIFTHDEELKEGIVKYSEMMPADVYNDLVDLDNKEAEVLIFLLEEKIADLERS